MSRTEIILWLALLIGAPASMIAYLFATFDPNNRYVVVDQRNGCDVIRYTPGPLSKFQYFLKCKDGTTQSSNQ